MVAAFLQSPDAVDDGPPLSSVAKRLPVVMPTAAVPSNWCWAATGSAISVFYDGGGGLSPCRIANKVFSANGNFTDDFCAMKAIPDDLNIAQDLQDVFSVIGHQKQGDGIYYADQPADSSPEPVGFDIVTREIEARQPICCHISWGDNDIYHGHYNAIIGYDPINQEICVADCQLGEHWIPFQKFCGGGFVNKQQRGFWNIAYLTVKGNQQ